MRKIIRIIFTLVLLFLSLLVVITPMSSDKQYLFGLSVIVVVFILGRFKGKKPVLAMLVFSLMMSTRYIWWRATTTLRFDSNLEMVLGALLFAAEIYSWTILVLGYVQMASLAHSPAARLHPFRRCSRGGFGRWRCPDLPPSGTSAPLRRSPAARPGRGCT